MTVMLGGTPNNSLYGEVPHERGTFFRLRVHERLWIRGSWLKYMKGQGNLSLQSVKGPT